MRDRFGLWCQFLLVLLCVAFSGCVSGYPAYKGKAGIDPAVMASYQNGAVDMLIPPGFKEVDLAPGSPKETKAFFQREGGGVITVMCFSDWVPNVDMDSVMLSTVGPESKVLVAPVCLRDYSGFVKPCFGQFSVRQVHEGDETWMPLWIAWKGSASMGCKYGLIGGHLTEEEFVAMVRSIK